MALNFEKFAMKGNEFINLLQVNLGNDDRDHAARILRSTFRVLRNHLTPEESLQLISQLPMALKSVYVDGWKLSEHSRIKTIDDFIVEILQEEGNSAWRDFSNKDDILDSIYAVFDTMKIYVSEEEMSQTLATLPKKLQTYFESRNLVTIQKII